MWMGRSGRLAESGVASMLRRWCAQAGIDPIKPHRFRLTFAHQWPEAGCEEGDLMMLAGQVINSDDPPLRTFRCRWSSPGTTPATLVRRSAVTVAVHETCRVIPRAFSTGLPLHS